MRLLIKSLHFLLLFAYSLAGAEQAPDLDVKASIVCLNDKPAMSFSLENLSASSLSIRLDHLPWAMGNCGARVWVKQKSSSDKTPREMYDDGLSGSEKVFLDSHGSAKGAILIERSFPNINNDLRDSPIFISWEYDYPVATDQSEKLSKGGGFMFTKELYERICLKE